MRRIAIIYYLVFAVIGSVFGQTSNSISEAELHLRHKYYFQTITTSDGLLSPTVRTVALDKSEKLWVGTTAGLQQYDGLRWKNFINNPTNSNSLGNNNIYKIIFDSYDRLWIGTLRGSIDRFDISSENFVHFLPDTSDLPVNNYEVVEIVEDRMGDIWFGHRFGLLKFDLDENGDVIDKQYYSKSTDGRDLSYIYNITELENGDLWLGGRDALYRKRTESDSIEPILTNLDDGYTNFYAINVLGSDLVVTSVYDNVIKIGNYNAHRDEMNIRITTRPEMQISVVGTSLATDQNIFYGGFGGVAVVTSRNDSLELNADFRKPPYLEEYFNSRIFDMTEQSDGSIIMATSRGMLVLNQNSQPFKTFKPDIGTEDAPLIYQIAESENEIILATSDGLLGVQKTGDGELIPQWHISGEQFDGNPCQRLMVDDGVIYASTNAALFRIEFVNGSVAIEDFEYNRFVNGGPTSSRIYGLVDADTCILMPSYTGILSFNKVSSRISEVRFPIATHISMLSFVNKLNKYVVGTQFGLWTYDQDSKVFEPLKFKNSADPIISNDRIKSIDIYNSETLVVGGGNGLHLVDLVDSTVQTLHYEDGLAGIAINNLWIENDIAWITHENGVSTLDLVDLAFKHYSIENGFLISETVTRSGTRHDGKFYYSNAEGLVEFDPGDAFFIQSVPNIEEVDVEISAINGSTIRTQQSIRPGNIVTISPGERRLKIRFSDPKYYKLERKPIYYRIKELGTQWHVSTNGEIVYEYLPSGTYQFEVSRIKGDQDSNFVLSIEVQPPWYKTKLAYAAAILTLLLVIFGFYRLRIRQIKSRERMKMAAREEIRKRSARDFHDEAGAHITKLGLMTEYLSMQQAQGKTEMDETIEKMRTEVQQLRLGMKDFIWVINPENDNLEQMLVRIKTFGNEIFEHSSTEFEFNWDTSQLTKLKLESNQRRHILLITQEALNNVVKYAKAHKCVVKIRVDGNQALLSIEDDGIGMDTQEVVTGNGIQNMKVRAAKIGGQLGIDSNKNQGTKITLQIPIHPNGG